MNTVRKRQMQAEEYLSKCAEICNEFEIKGLCDKCPLKKFSCGLPNDKKAISQAIEFVQNYVSNIFPFGRCQQCSKEFNSELINEYNISHCPWCGRELINDEHS